MGLLIIEGAAIPGAPDRVEIETASCAHCQAVIRLRRFDATRRYPNTCKRCGNKPICKYCAGIGECRPFAAKVEQAVKAGRWQEDFAHQFRTVSASL